MFAFPLFEALVACQALVVGGAMHLFVGHALQVVVDRFLDFFVGVVLLESPRCFATLRIDGIDLRRHRLLEPQRNTTRRCPGLEKILSQNGYD